MAALDWASPVEPLLDGALLLTMRGGGGAGARSERVQCGGGPGGGGGGESPSVLGVAEDPDIWLDADSTELPFTRFQRELGTGGAVGIDCAHNAAMMPGAAGGAPADLLEVVTSPTGMGTGNNGLPVLLPAAAFELTPAMLMAEA